MSFREAQVFEALNPWVLPAVIKMISELPPWSEFKQ